MRNILLVLFATMCVSFFASCGYMSDAREKAVTTGFKDIKELTVAVQQWAVPPAEVIATINVIASTLAQSMDPNNEVLPTKSAYEIYQGHLFGVQHNKPNPALKEIEEATKANVDDIGTWTWSGVFAGSLIALGFAGKLMGGPWNVAGTVLQGIGRRMVPDYDKTKKAVIGAIASVDRALTDYGDLLETLPETRKALTEKLGKDPVEWMKERLNKAQTDLNTPEVSEMMSLMKKHMTTEDGVLKPTTSEIDSFFKKML